MKERQIKEKATEPKRVGIWIRVSTEDQANGESPEHHRRRAIEYAGFQQWTVVETYDLAGVSGKTVMENPEAKRMIADLKRGHITGLIFSKLARLARNTRELLELADIFRDNNADMVSLQEKIDTSNPAGRLFFTMIAALSQWEREEIGDRVKASVKIRAKMGKCLGGGAPFGYQWVNNKMVIHPTEGPIRKLMYELFSKNKRRKSVARMLNDLGYRTRKGVKFSDTTVLRLIQDTTAKGTYRANYICWDAHGKMQIKPESEWVYTPVEALISEELWNECNDAINERKANRKPQGPTPVHLFAGVLHCDCGQRMYVPSKSLKYTCLKCRQKIPIETLEAIYREELKDFFVPNEKIQAHMAKADEFLNDKKGQLESHKKQYESVRTEMKKTYNLYQDDAISTSRFKEINSPLEERANLLGDELAKLQGTVDALEMKQISAEVVQAEAINLYNQWPKCTREEQRRIIESITEKIVLKGDEINITYSYQPSSEECTKSQRSLWEL